MTSHTFEFHKVPHSGRLAKEFIDFPKRLYRNSKYFIPLFDLDMRNLLKKKHPFFGHSDGDFFLLTRDGETAARVLVTENNRYNDFHKTDFAFFDFFDIINDQETANVLFDHLEKWTADHGRSELCGPMLSGGASGAGILIEGFDLPPAMTMMRYNYPYYRELLEMAGFTKYVDLNSFSIPPDHFNLDPRISRLAETVLKKGRFSVRRFRTKGDIKKIVEEIKFLYASTLNHHLEDYPLSDAELDQLAKDLLTIADPELIAMLDYDGRIIGYAFGFADITPVLRRNGGRLGPIAVFRLLTAMKKTRRILFNGIGILPEYQGLGGNALLYREIEHIVHTRKLQEIELVQISEKTDLMLSDAAHLRAEPYKVHRMYRKKIGL